MQVRDLDPAVDDRLKQAAAAQGLSYSEYLRRQLTRIAERLSVEERWAEVKAEHRIRSLSLAVDDPDPRSRIDLTTEEIVAGIREERDGR